MNASFGQGSATEATVAPMLRSRIAVSTLVTPAVIFAIGLIARVGAAAVVRFPLTEGSAYYVAVARNIAAGRGPVIDALWSYATPPLVMPRPAFELWQPLASFLGAAPMHALGATFASAQLAFALFGALLGPLTWWVARDAARRLDLPINRQNAVAAGAGVLVALGGPFVLAAAVPDSTLPFTVLAIGACACMPAAARGDRRAVAALGGLLGLAYLTRMEAVYLGIAFVAIAWSLAIGWRALVGRGFAVAAVGALVALPWWIRNASVFGTPLPGQLADNAFLTRNEQIFSFADRPTPDAFLAQGLPQIASNIGAAVWHEAVDVLLVPGSVMAGLGLLALVAGWHRRRALSGSPLAALLTYGAIAFIVTSVVFPVATLWGTFEHAAGPLLVAFAVLAVIAADAFVARVRAWRSWPRPNAWMAPAALICLVVPLTALQLGLAGAQAGARERELAAVTGAVATNADVAQSRAILTDRPIWLSDALKVPALALPDEPTASVLKLARQFGATAVVVVDGQGRYPDALRSDDARACFAEQPAPSSPSAPHMALFVIAEACR